MELLEKLNMGTVPLLFWLKLHCWLRACSKHFTIKLYSAPVTNTIVFDWIVFSRIL
jgi:hypothetical protein